MEGVDKFDEFFTLVEDFDHDPIHKSGSAAVFNNMNTNKSMRRRRTVQLNRHTDTVRDLATAGDFLFSCSDDGSIQCWNGETGEHVRELNAPDDTTSVRCLTTSSKGMLYSGGEDCTIREFDTNTGGLKRTFAINGHEGTVYAVALANTTSQDVLYSGGGDKIIIAWDLRTGKRLRTFVAGVAVRTICVHNSIMYSGGEDGTKSQMSEDAISNCICAWDVTTGDQIGKLGGHKRPVSALLVYDGVLYSGSSDYSIISWDITQGNKVGVIIHKFVGHTNAIRTLAVFNGVLFSGAWDHRVFAWNLATCEKIREFQGHGKGVECLTTSNDGQVLYSGSSDKQILAWHISIATFADQQSMAHGFNVTKSGGAGTGVGVSVGVGVGVGRRTTTPNAQDSASVEVLMQQHNTKSPQLNRTHKRAWRRSLWVMHGDKERAFTPRDIGWLRLLSPSIAVAGGRLYSASSDSSSSKIKVWDIKERCHVATYEGCTGAITALAASPTMLFASDTDNTITCWNSISSSSRKFERSHRKQIYCLAVGDDDSLYSGSKDTFVIRWNVRDGKPMIKFEGHTGLVRSIVIAGDVLISASDDTNVICWNRHTGKINHKLVGHKDRVLALAVSGSTVYSGCQDATIRAWNFFTGSYINCFKGHIGAVLSLAVKKATDIKSNNNNTKYKNKNTANSNNNTTTNTTTNNNNSSSNINDNDNDNNNDYDIVYSGSADRSLRSWHGKTGEQLSRSNIHNGSVYMLRVSDDLLHSASNDEIRNWDLDSMKQVSTFQGHVHADAVGLGFDFGTFSGHTDAVRILVTKGDVLYTGSSDKIVLARNLVTGEQIGAYGGMQGESVVLDLEVSGNRLFTVGSDMMIHVRDINTGRFLTSVQGHTGIIRSIAIWGDVLYTGSYDNTIRSWDLNTYAHLHTFEGHTHVVKIITVSDKGLFSGGADNLVMRWDRGTGTHVQTYEGHGDDLSAMILHADALYTGSHDTHIIKWDVESGKKLQTLSGHTAVVRSLVVSVAVELDDILYSASRDQNLIAWSVDVGTQLFTIPFNNPIMSIHIPDNFDELLVGMGDGNIFSVPHIFQLGRQTRMPPWCLELCARADRDHNNPDEQYATAASIIERYPGSTFGNDDFFLDLARDRSVIGLERCLFRQKAQFCRIPYSLLLAAAIESKSSECIRYVLQRAAASVCNSNDVANHKKAAHHQLAYNNDGGVFVELLIAQTDSLQLAFLENAPMLQVEILHPQHPPPSTNKPLSMTSISPSAVLWGLGTDRRRHAYESVVTPFPGFSALSTRTTKRFLVTLLLSHSPRVFGTLIVHSVVLHKWNTFAKSAFRFATGVYVVGLALIVLLSVYSSFIVVAVVGVMGVYGLFVEIAAFRALGHIVYEQDVFMWVRTFTAALSVFLMWLNVWKEVAEDIGSDAGPRDFKPAHEQTLAVLVYFKWIELYYYLQPYRNIGPVVKMILAILWEIKDILLALTISIVALANFLYVMLRGEPWGSDTGFTTPWESVFTTYIAMVMVNGDHDKYITGPYVHLCRFFFVLTSILGPIVLLNLLIARMSDSYERIQDEAEMEHRRLQAKVIIRFESSRTLNPFRSPASGAWLHVLLHRSGKNVAKVAKFMWAGTLNDIKSAIGEKVTKRSEVIQTNLIKLEEKMSIKIASEVDRVSADVENVQQQMKQQTDKVQKELAEVKAMLVSISRSLAVQKLSEEKILSKKKSGDQSDFGFGI